MFNRAQLINDSLVLARAGILDYEVALDNLDYLTSEADFIPYLAASEELKHVKRMFQRAPGFGALKKFLIQLDLPIFRLLGFEKRKNETSMETFLREKVLASLCQLGFEECVDEALEIFNEWQNSEFNGLSPN